MAKTEFVTMTRKDGTVLKVSKENAKIFEKCGYKIKAEKGKGKNKNNETPKNEGAQNTEE